MSATVPLHALNHRPHVDLAFTRADGTERIARFVVDTGGGGFILGATLARDIGATLQGERTNEGMQPCIPPAARIGDLALDTSNARSLIAGGDVLGAEGLLPGHLLARYHVIFDYIAGTFTLAPPGSVSPRGRPLPASIHPETGFPRVEVLIDNEPVGTLLDTGASYTMISEARLHRWAERHPDWPREVGAYGPALMGVRGEERFTMMRIPRVSWGPFALEDVGAVGRPHGTFEEWMSSMMTAPIVGALGNNVLGLMRIEIDYAAQTVFVERR